MIEVAVGILAAEPDKKNGHRNWAVDKLAHKSKDVELTDEAKNALRENRCLSMQMPCSRPLASDGWKRELTGANLEEAALTAPRVKNSRPPCLLRRLSFGRHAHHEDQRHTPIRSIPARTP